MRRSSISLIAGIFMALLAVIMMTNYMSPDDENKTPSNADAVQIVVAAYDLPFGTSLIRDNLKYVSWPADSLPEGVFTSMAALIDDAGKGGKRVVLRQVFKGEPVLQKKVSGFGDKATLSRKVDVDKRAYSIRVNDVSGVAGFLTPGDRVDIILTRSMEKRGDESLVTDIILQNIEILGIDQLTDEAAAQPVLARTVTVEVTTDQAQKLALAQQVGTLSLTLRSYANNDQANTNRVSTGDLAPELLLASETKNETTGRTIRVRRGMTLR